MVARRVPFAIVGAGPGGLALARCLREKIGHGSVALFDGRPCLPRPVERGLGIWNNAARCLNELVGTEGDLGGRGRLIPPAAYRNLAGRWLSRCRQTEANLKKVLSVEQNALFSLLADGAGDGELNFGAELLSSSFSRGVHRYVLAEPADVLSVLGSVVVCGTQLTPSRLCSRLC